MGLPSIHIVSHPPERRRRQAVTLACGCTCCCCCCLHSLGGIIGAAVAPLIGSGERLPTDYYDDQEPGAGGSAVTRSRASAVGLFWWLFLALSLLAGILFPTLTGPGGDNVVVGLVLLALALPGVQLLSAVITLFVLLVSARPDKGYQLKQLGKVTLGLVVGTVAGILAMVGFAFALGAFR